MTIRVRRFKPRQKRDGSTNKSELIRAYLRNNPKATAAEVVTGLASDGVTIRPTLVHAVKQQAKRRKTKHKRATAAPATNGFGGHTIRKLPVDNVPPASWDELVAARKFVNAVGRERAVNVVKAYFSFID